MELTLVTYALAVKLPASERFELSQQIRRASISIPSNVAEGHATGKDGMFLRHVCIALGSLAELDTQFELARRLGFLFESDLAAAVELINRAGQLLHGLRRSLRRKTLRSIATGLTLLGGPTFWLLFSVLR